MLLVCFAISSISSLVYVFSSPPRIVRISGIFPCAPKYLLAAPVAAAPVAATPVASAAPEAAPAVQEDAPVQMEEAAAPAAQVEEEKNSISDDDWDILAKIFRKDR